MNGFRFLLVVCCLASFAVGSGKPPAFRQPGIEAYAVTDSAAAIRLETVGASLQPSVTSRTGTTSPERTSVGPKKPDSSMPRVMALSLVVLALGAALLGLGLALLVAALRALRQAQQAATPGEDTDRMAQTELNCQQLLETLRDDMTRLESALHNLQVARGQADGELRQELARIPQQVAERLTQVQSQQESGRFQTAKQAFVQRTRTVLKDVEMRHRILDTARATATLVAKLRSRSVGDADTGHRYRLYVEATEMAENLAQLARNAERATPTTLDEDKSRFNIALDRLDRALTELVAYHRPIAFCDLLDQVNVPDLRTERQRLLTLLGVEEFAPRPAEAVADVAALDMVRVTGYGEKARVAEVVAPGYRIAATGEVIRKPRVVIEQTG